MTASASCQKQMTEPSTCITNVGKVLADSLEFSSWHPHNCGVLCFRNPKVLTVDVHELELKVGYSVILYMFMELVRRL